MCMRFSHVKVMLRGLDVNLADTTAPEKAVLVETGIDKPEELDDARCDDDTEHHGDARAVLLQESLQLCREDIQPGLRLSCKKRKEKSGRVCLNHTEGQGDDPGR